MENCQYISLTDDDDWDPTSVNLQDYMTKEIKQVNVRCETIEENESEHVLGMILLVYSIGSLTRQIQKTVRITSQVASHTRHSKLSPEHLARTWNIGLDRAKDTIQVTTQRGIRFAIHPIHQRYRVDHLLHLGLQARRIVKQFYVDHMQSRVKSLSQNTGAFIFTTGTFTKIYQVESTAKAGEVLAEFVRDVGVPTDLRADLASYFSGRNTDFVKEAKRLRIKLTYAEKGRHNQNHAAEREIRDIKRRWHNKMVSKGAPKRLWDYGVVHQAEIMSRMSRGKTGRTGYEDVTGETPDISEWVDFDFYDWIWYHDPPDTMAETTEEI
jgi:hypothetical protein